MDAINRINPSVFQNIQEDISKTYKKTSSKKKSSISKTYKKASPPESSEYRHRHLTSNLESALYRVHELKACIEPYPHRLSLAMSSSCCRR